MNPLTQQELLQLVAAHEEWNRSRFESGTHLTLEGADFSGMDLSGRDLTNCVLPLVNFERCRLVGINLYGTFLVKGSFVGANLTGAIIRKADLSDSNLAESILREVNLSNTMLYQAQLSHADLTSANLNNTRFIEANLEGAILRDADLKSASLTRCRLIGADLRGAKAVETVHVQDWIEVGTVEEPVKLEGQEIHVWLAQQVSK